MARWQYKDICYPNEAAALSAFNGTFVATVTGTTTPYAWFLNTSSVNATTGLITYTLKRNGSATLYTQNHQLVTCDDKSLNSVFDKMPVQDVAVAAALVICFLLGIGQGWKS